MRFLLFCLFWVFLLPSVSFAAVEKLSLPEGKSFLMLPSHTLPMAVVQISFLDAGSISDPKGKSGRAYLGAMMLKEGAGKLNGPDFRRTLEDHAIELSVSAERENLTITVQALSKHLPKAMELISAMLTEPHFDKTALTKNRSQALTHLKRLSQSPGWLANIHFDAHAFGDHAYALPVEGTEKSVQSLTQQDLQQWQQLFSAPNMLISATGDIDKERFSAQISALLKALPQPRSEVTIAAAPPIPEEKELIIIKQDIPQTLALAGLPSVERNDPDFYAAYVMNHILGGGGLTSRLSSEIRQERGLAYHASSYLSPGRYSSALYGSFATRNNQAQKAANVFRDVLQNFAEHGATEAEVQNAIDYLTGSFPLALDNLISQASYLTSMQRYQLGSDYLEKRNGYFRAVTTEDVNRVARKYLAKSPLILLVGNPQGD